MKITIIGGGAWGSTIAQLLTDNNNKILINDINKNYIDRINNGKHPIFDLPLTNVRGTLCLKEALTYSDFIILCIPTKFIRFTLKQINLMIVNPKYFVNASKGFEISSYKTINQIFKEEISENKYQKYGCIMGPSHAEEVILRKLTFLVTASYDLNFSKKLQNIFFNPFYLRTYTNQDLNGVETCSAFKNVLALISGILEVNGFGSNTNASFISRGLVEMSRVVHFLGGKKETVFGLAGLGDLIVTAFNSNSRNFQAGKKIGSGISVDDIIKNAKQTIEGIDNLKAFYNLSLNNKLELPIIQEAYKFIFQKQSLKRTVQNLIKRPLKSEKLL